MAARKTHGVELGALSEVETPRGALAPGAEFTINGQGRHRVSRIRPNGEINAWPIKADGNARDVGGMRTFKPSDVDRIHRPRSVTR